MLQTGKVKEEAQLHDKEIRDMQLYMDGTHMVTASVDKMVKLVDTQTLEVLKSFNTDRPANAAALSPIFDQVNFSSGLCRPWTKAAVAVQLNERRRLSGVVICRC